MSAVLVTNHQPNKLSSLGQIRIVLVEPTHPGNIGSVARAMKTMGLSRLVLVNPKKFPHSEASKLAAGAESVLLNAEVVQTTSEAIGDCTMVLGTSVRDREVSWPTFSPRKTAANVDNHLSHAGHQVAILFGRESSGLTNAEMDLCQSQIRISANEEYSSLNLASAVQIIAYELRMKLLGCDEGHRVSDDDFEPEDHQVANASLGSKVSFSSKASKGREIIATNVQQSGHMEHLQKTLEALDFIRAKPPTVLMRKLTRLYGKANLTVEEIQILRGILSAVESTIASLETSATEDE
ncbi:MAG: tRNA (cytidine32/uridine32-2'-O)-methyltransferase [Arenicella sp.]|jgi:tRNA (cytidine32/uridine32-2'-O)-methyltransferase